MSPQSLVLAGLIKVPLFAELPFYIFQKSGRLVLWEIISILELQFAETQDIYRLVFSGYTIPKREIFLIIFLADKFEILSPAQCGQGVFFDML